MKSSEVCIKTRSPPASLPIQDQVTKHTTVKWAIPAYTFELSDETKSISSSDGQQRFVFRLIDLSTEELFTLLSRRFYHLLIIALICLWHNVLKGLSTITAWPL